MRLPERSSGSASPLFSRQRRIRAASSLPMMIRASEPPIKERRANWAAAKLRTLSDIQPSTKAPGEALSITFPVQADKVDRLSINYDCLSSKAKWGTPLHA
jgi:hypothetical protein